MLSFMTTLFENIKIRARYLSSTFLERNPGEPLEEDESANDLAQAICEEMERLTARLEKIETALEDL